jgi:hypothetical protein
MVDLSLLLTPIAQLPMVYACSQRAAILENARLRLVLYPILVRGQFLRVINNELTRKPPAEIFAIIAEFDLVKTYDEVAAVNWVTWDETQWVSYDDGESMAAKLARANNLVSS